MAVPSVLITIALYKVWRAGSVKSLNFVPFFEDDFGYSRSFVFLYKFENQLDNLKMLEFDWDCAVFRGLEN